MGNYLATHDERVVAADCLGQLIMASRQLQVEMGEVPPTGTLRLVPARDVNAAVRVTSLHQAVATDHLAALTAVLALPASHGPSLATLERTLLETWARAWWVMAATTATRAEYRARAMVVDELHAGAARGIRMLFDEPIEDAIARATREREAIKVLGQERIPTPTALVRSLLHSCGSSEESARAIYSHLSGVAHGESVFTSSFTGMPTEHPVPVIALPTRNLANYCSTLLGVVATATSQLIRAWGMPRRVENTFAQAVADVAADLMGLHGVESRTGA